MTELDLIEEWGRASWVESANEAECGFPLASLPYCVFVGEDGRARPGVGIGRSILDLQLCSRSGLFEGLPQAIQAACVAKTLDPIITCGAAAHAALRGRLRQLLEAGADEATREAVSAGLFPMNGARLLKPVEPGNFTDFYASMHHALRVGRLFRPEQPLLPNYPYVPIGYHGRTSSIVVSGTAVRRPRGQSKPAHAGGIPAFGPSRFLDYEVEVGMYIADGNALGDPVDIRDARERIFGLSLLNDWSARDLQAWEYQPLGPFLGKSFATSVSPWVVPLEALKPFHVPARIRPNDPSPLDYLWDAMDQYTGAFDLTLEAFLLTPEMRGAGLSPHRLSRANLRDLYWTPAQMIAHHTSNGCNLLPGDLVATGTVSGVEEEAGGCLLELTRGGAEAIKLPNGESRTALEDGDEVILRGHCKRKGFPFISLGECRGTVLASQ